MTGGETDEQLARHTIRTSATCAPWMVENGVRFQPSLGGTLHLSRTNAFFLGGGKALVNAYYRTAEKLGVEVAYDTEARDLDIRDGRFHSATVVSGGSERKIDAKTLVAAAGGFESNIPWLKDAWGPAADNFLIRGTPYNMGRVLRVLLDRGAKQIGDPTQCHAVAIDARSPKFDGGICTRVDCVSLGIVVNRARQALLRRGRGFLAEALRDLGPARRRAARPDRLLDHRLQGDRQVHAAGVSAGQGRLDRRARARARARSGGARGHRPTLQRCGPSGHLQPCNARRLHDRRASSRRRRTGRGRSTPRPTSATRCAPESLSPTSAWL